MGRLYGVALISRSQMRDLTLETILNDGEFDTDSYTHEGDFTYIFELNNILNTKISKNTIVYKTLNGALRFKNRFKGDWVMNLRYAVMGDDGNWVRNKKNDGNYEVVVVDITEEWDTLIDTRIEERRKSFEEDIRRLESKKSKK
jgi:hypothetical protein